MKDIYAEAAEKIRNAQRVIAVTGAGISVESGIPDFRSPGGLWTKYPPFEYATVDAFHDDPDKVWVMFYELGETLMQADPNPAHYALAHLEEKGFLQAIITQNIDALHQRAGSSTVIEYHGNAETLSCSSCFRHRRMEVSHRDHGAPRCECGSYMKPNVILFGEAIPPQALLQSETLARTCDALIIVGTSAQVYPAAGLPYTAKDCGAYIIECNVQPTDFTRSITDAFLEGPAGTTLPHLAKLVTGEKD